MLSPESGATCLGASFLWGELSWGERSLGRVVRNPNTAVKNKRHSIKSILGEWRPALRPYRKVEVVLARLRNGNSLITHS